MKTCPICKSKVELDMFYSVDDKEMCLNCAYKKTKFKYPGSPADKYFTKEIKDFDNV